MSWNFFIHGSYKNNYGSEYDCFALFFSTHDIVMFFIMFIQILDAT